MDAFKPIFLKAGLNPEQVKIIMEGYDGQVLELAKEASDNAVNPVEARDTVLKKEWGVDFETNMSKANMAAKQLDPTGDIFNGTASTDPAFIKMMAKVAELVGGDSMIVPEGGTPKLESIGAEMSTIRDNPAYRNANNQDHPRLVERYKMLAQQRSKLRN